jgi:dCTP deaminase
MILTDREIEIFIASGQIKITPQPDADAYSSTSLDLTLDEPGEIWKEMPGQPVQPNARGYKYKQLEERKKKISLGGYNFAPHTLLLGWTRETVILPYTSRVAARVEGKSGLARLGLLVHMTAPTIHAGFTGQIQLEMCNLGPYPIILDVGMPICQLVFEVTFGTPAKGYVGQFAGQAAKH